MIKKFDSFAVIAKTGSINTNNIDESIKKSLSLTRGEEFFSVAPVNRIASVEQVWAAAQATLSAFSSKKAFSSKPGIEFLARLTARRKISEALDIAEFPPGKRADALLLLAVGNPAKGKKVLAELEKLLEFRAEKGLIEKNLRKNAAQLKKLFGISPAELKAMRDLPEQEALKLLVLERQAMLALEKGAGKN